MSSEHGFKQMHILWAVLEVLTQLVGEHKPGLQEHSHALNTVGL